MSRSAFVIALLLLSLTGSAAGRGLAGSCRTISVTRTSASFPHLRSLQAAVDSARPCDWILISPGVYPGSVTIKTPELHLRGLDRNLTIIDGGHRAGNGITIEADDVSIENLTVRNFDRSSINDDDTGNEVRWLSVHGWEARYLTVYDTGLLGGYGLWASRSRDGVLDQAYASGFSDSGLYVGACRDCHALIQHATAEHNLIGLAATNASGHIVIEHSLFLDNAVGVSLNSSLSDPPPPQFGSCNAGRNRSLAPKVATTRLARCTVFRHNRVIANNALDTPSETASVRPGAGIGIELLGTAADLIANNIIRGNRNIGVLELPLPEIGVSRFPVAGNRISSNRIGGSRLAIALAGTNGSVDNCVQGNTNGPTEPTDLNAYSCTRATTPHPPAPSNRRVETLVNRLHAQLVSHPRHGEPAPAPQPTMRTPCRDAPPNPLCATRTH